MQINSQKTWRPSFMENRLMCRDGNNDVDAPGCDIWYTDIDAIEVCDDVDNNCTDLVDDEWVFGTF
jgi:hypothetical protein